MYETVEDPYCYPGTDTLINKLEIREPELLAAFEAEMTAARAEEPLPAGRLGVAHYRKVRSTRISKGGSMFCYPENIASEMQKQFAQLKQQRFLRNLLRRDFVARAAHFLAELNAIHPFRDGNGRAQLAFMTLLAYRAGHPFDLDVLDTEAMIPAMEASFKGDEGPLKTILLTMCQAAAG